MKNSVTVLYNGKNSHDKIYVIYKKEKSFLFTSYGPRNSYQKLGNFFFNNIDFEEKHENIFISKTSKNKNKEENYDFLVEFSWNTGESSSFEVKINEKSKYSINSYTTTTSLQTIEKEFNEIKETIKKEILAKEKEKIKESLSDSLETFESELKNVLKISLNKKSSPKKEFFKKNLEEKQKLKQELENELENKEETSTKKFICIDNYGQEENFTINLIYLGQNLTDSSKFIEVINNFGEKQKVLKERFKEVK